MNRLRFVTDQQRRGRVLCRWPSFRSAFVAPESTPAARRRLRRWPYRLHESGLAEAGINPVSFGYGVSNGNYPRGFTRVTPFGQSCLNWPSLTWRFFISLV